MRGDKSILSDHQEVYRPRVVEPLPASIRRAVLERDGHQCQFCLRRSRLHIHHIDGCGAVHPRPNHDPANLVTLCGRCHGVMHKNGLAYTPELVRMVNERRNTATVNLVGEKSYFQNEHVVRPHKLALRNLEPDEYL